MSSSPSSSAGSGRSGRIASPLICAVRAELCKLVSLPLGRAVIVAGPVVVLAASWGLTALVDAAIRAGRAEDAAGLEPGSAFLVILHYAQIVVVLVAAVVMQQEEERGALRATVIAVPQRALIVVAKASVLAGVAAATGAFGAVGSSAARCLIVDCADPANAFAASAGDEARILLGYSVYATLIALLTFALAVLLRSSLTAMGIVLSLALAVSAYLERVTPAARFLPDRAGAQLYLEQSPTAGEPGPFLGGLVLLGWAAAALIAAAIVLRRRSIAD